MKAKKKNEKMVTVVKDGHKLEIPESLVPLRKTRGYKLLDVQSKK